MSAPGQAPLAGLKVVDLTTFLSGPYATQIFADLGASVIKVEQPAGGDPTRILPPHFVHGDSAYFHSINRNKRSVAVDLKHPEGRGILLDLVAQCDVLIENFRPGVMDRLHLGWDALRAANPLLIHCSLTGFGIDGPYRDYPAYDMVVQALSGGMSMTGERNGPAVRAGVPIGDLAAGMFSVIGILAALRERESNGCGRQVDVSMLDCQVSMLSYQAEYTLVSGKAPGRQGSAHDSIPTYRSFQCGDGKAIVVTANNEKMWAGLCRTIGCPELVEDPRFLTNADRFRNREELGVLLEARFLEQSSQDIAPKLMAAGVPAAPINSVLEALADPQVVHRGMVVDAVAEDGKSLKMVGNPVRFDHRDVSTYHYPPALGEHTFTVLHDDLGIDAARIAQLAEAGVLRLDPQSRPAPQACTEAVK
ncbi:CaiB/BaiF CoA-transferase family protein [Oleispirillum naphthae]|uniref:CaiB/BaiF CoA transferase family protein n=1 Tax=Oleispirillum naphthae TaxID=2838853 RepID=UPI0030823BB3